MGVLRLHRCPLLVLDEADQLLGDVYARHINTLMQVIAACACIS
jgi:superfamily II DNA/RNA helicase